MRISTRSTHCLPKFIVFPWDAIPGGQLRFLIDLRVDGLSLFRIRFLEMGFIEFHDPVQVGLFLFEIDSGEPVISLRHQMFLVVRHSGVVGRIVLAARTHGNLCINPGFLVVLSQVYGQTVVQAVDMGGHRVIWIVFVDPRVPGHRRR